MAGVLEQGDLEATFQPKPQSTSHSEGVCVNQILSSEVRGGSECVFEIYFHFCQQLLHQRFGIKNPGLIGE